MIRKSVAIILCFCLLFGVVTPVLASTLSYSQYEKDGFIYYDYTSETPLNSSQITTCEKYEIELSDTSFVQSTQPVNIMDFVLSQSTLISSYSTGDISIQNYSSNTLPQYLYQCNELIEISLINNLLYITYFTADEIEVRLVYSNTGLSQKVIYFPETDTAIMIDGYSATQYNNFRHGTFSEISEELETEIELLVERGDWNSLSAIECIDIDFSINCTEIETNTKLQSADISSSVLSSSASQLYGFTSDAAMLSNLKKDFPIRNGVTVHNNTYYSDILNRYYSVKVTQTRNAYVRKTSDHRSFAISTAISVISTYLAIAHAPTISILTILGIGITGTDILDHITESVTLYRSAKYQFLGCQDGYVWDDTLYNQYVHVVFHSGYGEFTGGYASNGQFTWIMSEIPTAYDHAETSIATKALELYSKNVYATGHCSMYAPD